MALHNVLEQQFLLFTILSYLPQHDLLIVQRVCRTWRCLIISSHVLQVALFLEPDIGDDTTTGDEPPPVLLNPLLQSRFPAFFDEKVHRSTSAHPEPWGSTHWLSGGRAKETMHLLQVSEVLQTPEAKQRMAAYSRAEASWRRMIPCRPAAKELFVYYGSMEARTKRGPAPDFMSGGKLKILRFSGHPQQQHDDSNRQGQKQGEYPPLEPGWPTFGLLYDILQRRWFKDLRRPGKALLVDFGNETVSWSDQHGLIGQPGDAGCRGIYRQALQRMQQEKDFMGVDKAFIYIGKVRCCKRESVQATRPAMQYQFQSQGSHVEKVTWCEELSL